VAEPEALCSPADTESRFFLGLDEACGDRDGVRRPVRTAKLRSELGVVTWGVTRIAGSGTFLALSTSGSRQLAFTSRDGLSWYDEIPRGMVTCMIPAELLYGAGHFLLAETKSGDATTFMLGTPRWRLGCDGR
jgi:hypothetical protein